MKKIAMLCLLTLMMSGTALAEPFAVSASDKETFDTILEPVMKIYQLIKYAASVIALVILTIAGIHYMGAGVDQKKKETAKYTAGYVFIGLALVWAAPYAVDFIIG